MQNVWSNLSRILIRVIFLNYVQKNYGVRQLEHSELAFASVCVCSDFYFDFPLPECSRVHRTPRLTTIIRYAAVTIAVFRRSIACPFAYSLNSVCLCMCIYEINRVFFSVKAAVNASSILLITVYFVPHIYAKVLVLILK